MGLLRAEASHPPPAVRPPSRSQPHSAGAAGLPALRCSVLLCSALPCSAPPGRCKVNLLAFNSHEGSPFRPSSREQIQAFRSVLIQASTCGPVLACAGLSCEALGSPCCCCFGFVGCLTQQPLPVPLCIRCRAGGLPHRPGRPSSRRHASALFMPAALLSPPALPLAAPLAAPPPPTAAAAGRARGHCEGQPGGRPDGGLWAAGQPGCRCGAAAAHADAAGAAAGRGHRRLDSLSNRVNVGQQSLQINLLIVLSRQQSIQRGIPRHLSLHPPGSCRHQPLSCQKVGPALGDTGLQLGFCFPCKLVNPKKHEGATSTAPLDEFALARAAAASSRWGGFGV